VEPFERHTTQEVLAKGTEVRPIAKAAGSDGDQLPPTCQHSHDQGQKRGVEIARFNSGRPQNSTNIRIAVDLSVWRVKDGHIESAGLLKERGTNAAHRRLDEIYWLNVTLKLYTDVIAMIPAQRQGLP
jgi:hypothetical protein